MILSDLIEQQAQSSPDKMAYIFKETSLTFGDLHQKILSCATGLEKRGITKGSTFGLVLRNCPEFVILTMALAKLGAVAVPINFLEKADRIALILNDCTAVGVLTSKDFLTTILKAKEKIPSLKHIFLRDGEAGQAQSFSDLISNNSNSDRASQGENSDLVMLLYTSGTTGNPKGVMLTNKNLLSNMDQCLQSISLTSKDRVICLLPMFHSFAWTTCVLIPLKLGALCVINESLLPFDPVIKSIWKYKITLFVAVPQIYSALVAKIKGFKALILRFLNPVHICVSGAAPLPPIVHQKFENIFKIPLLEGYGLTETSPVVSLNPANKRKVGTVGKPLPGVQVKIVDDNGKTLSQGDIGEIWIKGDNVLKGYYNKPNETKEVLTPDGWLKSGDMGRFDEDGYLSIVDRKKDLIIVKGLNVYPQEIEAVISKDPTINEVAVIGKMDSQTGEETIKAFVTLKEGAQFNKSELTKRCRDNLASYKRPKVFIVLDEMPKNALQKILKKDLRSR